MVFCKLSIRPGVGRKERFSRWRKITFPFRGKKEKWKVKYPVFKEEKSVLEFFEKCGMKSNLSPQGKKEKWKRTFLTTPGQDKKRNSWLSVEYSLSTKSKPFIFSSKRDEEAIKLAEEAIELSKKTSKTKTASKTKLKKKSSSTVAKKKSSPYLIRNRSHSAPPKEWVIILYFKRVTQHFLVLVKIVSKVFRGILLLIHDSPKNVNFPNFKIHPMKQKQSSISIHPYREAPASTRERNVPNWRPLTRMEAYTGRGLYTNNRRVSFTGFI